VTATAVNNGADLDLSWEPVEGASTYRIYGDGNMIAEIDSTHFVLAGADGVYSMVEVEAVGGGKYSLDLMPFSKDLGVVYTHDDPDSTHHSWIKVCFGDSVDASTTNQAGVDTTLDATAYFVFYNNAGTLQFKDIHRTSIGMGKVYTRFADHTREYLAPNSTSDYMDEKDISGNSMYYTWFDLNKDGNVDNSDYFGMVEVGATSGTGPYSAPVKVYVQDKVAGLGWLKY